MKDSIIGATAKNIRGQHEDKIIDADFLTKFDESDDLDVSSQGLTGVKDSPKIVADFVIDHNNITSLEGGPEEVESLFADHNLLSTFEGFPREINYSLSIAHNKFTTLHNIHKFIRRVNDRIWLEGNPIRDRILGLLLITGLQKMSTLRTNTDLDKALMIINKYLPNTRGMAAVNECQDELIEADLEDFAEL